jgi:Protein of unknown function (DUF3606)
MNDVSDEEQHVRIDPKSDADVERWARRLGVPQEEFRRAAERAGPRIGDIRQHLIGGFTTAGPTS